MNNFIFDGQEISKADLLKEIESMEFPAPSNGIDFTMMQKLFAYWVKNKHYYGNWSGTGVGKTYSFILASRVIDAHLTVVIGANSTTHQLANEIKELYSDSVVEVYDGGDLPAFDMSQHNYLVFNYEKGQQKNSQHLFNSVLDMYKVDYIVFDEVQMVKQTGKASSCRRDNFKDFADNARKSHNSYVSVLTATPYTNNISEVISILSLMTGETYHHIKKKNILKNTIAVENLLNSLGITANTEPKNVYGKVIGKNINIVEVVGDENTFENFKSNIKKGPSAIYQTTLQAKLDALHIEKGDLTIIYTQFIKGIIGPTKDFLTKKGFKVCEYTGSKKDTDTYTGPTGKVNWKSVQNGYDVILASKPIAVSVDGLQKVCNKMVILTLPWTDADYQQLIGRIYRKNSVYDSVEICIPVVRFPQVNNVGYDDKVWNSITCKSEYSNACLNGEFPTECKATRDSFVVELERDMNIEYNNVA